MVKDPPYNGNLTDRRAEWRWLDGTPYEWMNWLDEFPFVDSEPSGDDGVARMMHDGVWKDDYANKRYRYICEKSESRRKSANFMN